MMYYVNMVIKNKKKSNMLWIAIDKREYLLYKIIKMIMKFSFFKNINFVAYLYFGL